MKKVAKIMTIVVVILVVAYLVHLKVSINIRSNTQDPPTGSFDWYYLNMLNSPNAFDDALRDIPKEIKGNPQKFLDDKLLPLVKVLELLPIEGLSNEKMGDNAVRCHILSNFVVSVSRKILKEKQNDNIKLQILEMSARIVRIARKLRNFTVKFNELSASTSWLSVASNDIYLNVLVKINDIVYDDKCDTTATVDYDITDIMFRLNESVDRNVYTNILEEIEYDNKELIQKLHKKLSKLGCYEKKNITTQQKFLKHIKEFALKK